ncbi:AEC family transporter [Salaquimonas pukyongi]|uniref:AEC family transporter n=1 Tax=Salaquimonas pukyongi TaxID=2712698 RepID=UPI00096B7F02|nr:AEC family transporter [Salaquimonas pukyongi]
MLTTLVTILPVFLVLAAGWLAVRTGYLDEALSDQLNAFAVRLAVPVLLFRAMVDLDFGQAFQIRMLAGFYLGGFASFFAGTMLARVLFGRRPGEAVAVGFCALFSNTVLLGIPIVQRAYGDDALTPVYGIVALHAGVMYALGMSCMELARADGRSIGETVQAAARSILANPLMIGVIAGVLVNVSGFALPAVLRAPVDMLATAAIPAALVGLGAALTRYQLKSEIAESLMVASLSLVLHPAIAFAITHLWFGLPADLVRAAVVVAAMPPGLNVYIFAAMYNRAVSLSASAILVTTSLSIVTIAVWLWLLKQIL